MKRSTAAWVSIAVILMTLGLIIMNWDRLVGGYHGGFLMRSVEWHRWHEKEHVDILERLEKLEHEIRNSTDNAIGNANHAAMEP